MINYVEAVINLQAFNVNFKLFRKKMKDYIIKFDEPYCDDQDKLIFDIDFGKVSSGEYCVNRDTYPWGL